MPVFGFTSALLYQILNRIVTLSYLVSRLCLLLLLSLLRDVPKNETELFAEKIKHLVKIGEKIDSKWVYGFASHPRFGFWANKILHRRRLLGRGNYF